MQVTDDIDDIRKAIMKMGGAPCLVDFLKSFMDKPKIVSEALNAIGAMAQMAASVSLVPPLHLNVPTL